MSDSNNVVNIEMDDETRAVIASQMIRQFQASKRLQNANDEEVGNDAEFIEPEYRKMLLKKGRSSYKVKV